MNEEKPIQANISVDLNKCETLACSCGNETFTEVITLKKISALLSPTGREMIAELRQKICLKCGEKFVPKEAREERTMNGQKGDISEADPGV